MATWIPAAEHPEPWLSSLGVAFARLEGYERELRTKEEANGKTRVELIVGDKREPHKESFFTEGGERTLDYSDDSMLKDQTLR